MRVHSIRPQWDPTNVFLLRAPYAPSIRQATYP